MTIEKMTHAKAVEWVLNTNFNIVNEIPADVKEHLNSILNGLQRKSTSPKKPTKTQKENVVLSDTILSEMHIGRAYTISAMMKELECCEGLTNQKITALMSKIVDDGKVNREKEKGISYYTKVV